VNGGIKKNSAGRASAGPCTFSTAEPVVRIILTVMKFDPAMRSGAVIQYSDRTHEVLENDLFLDCVSLKAASSQQAISTMDWEIASCCKERIPDVIFSKGDGSGESRIILLGEDPADVINNIIICSNRI
jgi:hydroxymethylpyrimidine/phosphomethylpyrimidine kinase